MFRLALITGAPFTIVLPEKTAAFIEASNCSMESTERLRRLA
ncbi:hypothetical protein SPNHU15_01789 [Streptococcus pneumoniae]|nr:hypothetical protein SPNHU15_01789 [Streptococcus pneumoniae]